MEAIIVQREVDDVSTPMYVRLNVPFLFMVDIRSIMLFSLVPIVMSVSSAVKQPYACQLQPRHSGNFYLPPVPDLDNIREKTQPAEAIRR